MTAAEGKKRKVLVVAFEFPPTGGIGAVRIGKFAKYLPEFGWEPMVLTADRPEAAPQTLPVETDGANVFRAESFILSSVVYDGLGGEEHLSPYSTPKGARWRRLAHRALKLLKPIYTLPVLERLVADPIGWYYYGTKLGQQILRSSHVDVIFSSSNPPTAHFIAAHLHRKTGIPWVAEFRDLWVDPYNARSRAYEFVERQLEKTVLRGAALLVAASEPHARLLEAFHHKQTAVIHNGFDDEDYRERVPLLPKFTVTYTGNIYPGKRDPSVLFQAISAMKREGQVSPDDFEVRLLGGKTLENLRATANRLDLGDMVKICGRVPFRESIRHQQESTALLLLEWDDPRAAGVYSGKVFEYLGAGRPIIAIGYRHSVIGRLLRETGTGVLVDDVETAKQVLSQWLVEWRERGRIVSGWQPKDNAIRAYTRREQTERLARVLDEVAHA